MPIQYKHRLQLVKHNISFASKSALLSAVISSVPVRHPQISVDDFLYETTMATSLPNRKRLTVLIQIMVL